MRASFVKQGLLDFIKILPSELVLVEVGCFSGQSTQMFLDSGKIKKIICIDKWENGYDPDDIASNQTVHAKKIFDNMISKYDNVKVIQEYSDDALKYIDELVDIVYIDGDHRYEQVKKDIINYTKIIKQTGLISGHDYHLDDVRKAVNETIGKPEMIFQDHSWRKNIGDIK